MNYLTNYYKNLCEQLEEKIVSLQETIRSAAEIRNIGAKKHDEALIELERKLGRPLTAQESHDLLNTVFVPYIERAAKRENLTQRAMGDLRHVASSGDVETAQQVGDVMAAMSTRDIGGSKQAGFSDRPDWARNSAIEHRKAMKELAQDAINRGRSDVRPPDIAAIRKFIQMGKGKYKAPFPEPPHSLGEQIKFKVNNLIEKLDPVGQEDADVNNDGKVETLPFEILGIDAPLDYGKTNFNPGVIGIYGRHVRPDGSRGPEVIIPTHAFTDMHHNDVIDHAEDFMKGKGKRSPNNPFFKAWDDQGGDRPATFQVDPSKIESIESYNQRVREEGL